MNIVEGNKIIAEFMGIKYYEDEPTMKIWLDDYDGTLFYCEWHPNIKIEDTNIVGWQWQPNKTWCQLMPVVEKIESLKYQVSMRPHSFQVYDVFDDMIIDADFKNTRLENAWDGVIAFIEWYNKNQTK